jgi:hypothetical protein
MNYDANNSHRHSVSKFRVINHEDVLRKLICFLIGGGGGVAEFFVTCDGIDLTPALITATIIS